MADTAWLQSIAPKIIAGVPTVDQSTVTTTLTTFNTRLASAPASVGANARNSFIGSMMGRGLDSAAGAAAGVLTPLTSSVNSIRSLLNSPVVNIAALESAAAPLRAAARDAWKTVAAAGQAARAAERLENTAALVAKVTGLPPVTAAWAAASSAAKAAVDTAEVAARAGRVADTAWASAQKVIDDLIDANAGVLNDLSGIMDDTLASVISVPATEASAVYTNFHADLTDVFDNVVP